MKFEESLQNSKREGIEQGRDWERTRMLKLLNCMIRAGETGELSRLEQDSGLLQEMLEKYHL